MFNTTKLTGHRVLIEGVTSDQQYIADSSQWDEYKQHLVEASVADGFDTAVQEMFAPLVAAAEAAEAALAASLPKPDPNAYVQLQEGEDATEGVQAIMLTLNKDSQILRLIESGDTDRLRWVKDSIEILEYVEPTGVEIVEDAEII